MGTEIYCSAERRRAGKWEACTVDFFFSGERDYGMAALLTDFNKYGGRDFEPIAKPRGYPIDSPTVGHLAHEPETGTDHNRTWLSLRELLDFPWHERTVRKRGYVFAEDYLDYWVDRSQPRWHYAAPPQGCRVISNQEMERLITDAGDTDRKVTLMEYGTPYALEFERFYRETLPLLSQLGAPEDVRIIVSLSS